MAYNMSWMANTTTLGGIVVNVNTMMNDIFFILLLLLFYIFTFKYIGLDNISELIVSFLVVSLLAALLWAGGFIAWYVTFIPFVLLMVSVIYAFFVK